MLKEVNKVNKIQGIFIPPPDKSITHRAVFISSISEGNSVVHNHLSSDDCLRTITAMEQMGVDIKVEKKTKKLYIHGKGLYGLSQSKNIIDAGNSGTTMRLISGILAGQNFISTLTGDESLSRRPMDRIIEPLERMGAKISSYNGKYPPLKIYGKRPLTHIFWENKIGSAQVKSCILFAGLYADSVTEIIEPFPSRDHTERMLSYYGAQVTTEKRETGVSIKIYPGKAKLYSQEVYVPGDISSAAFFITAALLLPGSELIIKDVGFNPSRIGFIKIVQNMCYDKDAIKVVDMKEINNEPVATMIVKHSKICPINISGEIIPQIIDEIPLISLLGTQADGITIISGAQELRVKESDRIKTTVTELRRLGAKIDEKHDGMVIHGPTKLKGTMVESYNDHRIAMMLAIAGFIADGRTVIKDSECVKISFPEFWSCVDELVS